MRGGRHIEILVEGRSMKDAVDQLMPRIAPGVSFASHDLGSKSEFMAKAPRRLRGYAHEMAANDRLAVLLLRDRDTEDCGDILRVLQDAARSAGCSVASVARRVHGQAMVRLADEMLEAWFLGDGRALHAAFPRIPASIGTTRAYRVPDRVRDPARRLERELQKHGYYPAGLSKIDLVSKVAPHLDVDANSSRSFAHFRDGVRLLCQAPPITSED